jgi:hypothetical protein
VRRFLLLAAGAAAVIIGLLLGLGSRPARQGLRVVPECLASGCDSHAATLSWGALPPWGHVTAGYNVFLNGSKVGQTSQQSWAFKAMDCGTTVQVGVQAFDADSHVSHTYSTNYTMPACTASPAPGGAAVPVVTSSNAQVAGNTVTARTGTWAAGATRYTYQWFDCVPAGLSGQQCSPIAGATSSGYTLASGDIGQTVEVRVTASNSSGSTAASSIQTGIIGSAGARTFYVSYTSGSDSNSGTSRSAPWRDAPGMQLCSANCARYSPQAGATAPQHRHVEHPAEQTDSRAYPEGS